jgi:hypothetical protein
MDAGRVCVCAHVFACARAFVCGYMHVCVCPHSMVGNWFIKDAAKGASCIVHRWQPALYALFT